jgi:hypothetical protein
LGHLPSSCLHIGFHLPSNIFLGRELDPLSMCEKGFPSAFFCLGGGIFKREGVSGSPTLVNLPENLTDFFKV